MPPTWVRPQLAALVKEATIACEHGLEGIVSKRIKGRYEPDRRSWVKTKCLNREDLSSSAGLTRRAVGIGSVRYCERRTGLRDHCASSASHE